MLARQKIAELTSTVVTLRAENSLLRSQLLRFENVVRQLLFFTGLELSMWSALWTFMKPVGGILSGRVDTSEYRLNNYGGGRKDKLSLEDQLMMTMMQLRWGDRARSWLPVWRVFGDCLTYPHQVDKFPLP